MPHLPSRFEWRTPQDPSVRTAETLAFVADELSWRAPDWFERINVVLVEPTDVVNIGGVVRVMANTGFSRLRLVKPVEFETWDVIGVAHYTQHIVEQAPIVESLNEAIRDAHFVLALTGKHQSAKRTLLPMDAALDQVVSAAQAGQTVALLFGPEDTGFTNVMLDGAHALTTIPTNPAYPSLNLAQAALLVLYQLFLASGGGKQRLRPPARKTAPADAAQLEDLFTDLERLLEAIGFLRYRSPVATMRSLRVALTRARLDRREAGLLRAIFIEVRKFLVRRGALEAVGQVGRQRAPGTEEPS